MLRSLKVVLVLTVCLWGYVGALFNVIDWSGTLGSVVATTSMATFEGGAEGWQATSNPILIWIGALFIMLSKLATGILCTIGALKMWQARRSDATAFATAKEFALAGCAVAVIMLFGGFVVIAET